MGLLNWLFGGTSKTEDKGEGTQHMQATSMPSAGMGAGSGMHMQNAGPASAMNMAKDPVCGMDVSPEKAAATSNYYGTTYYFCAPACRAAFDEEPEKYLGMPSHGGHGCCH